MAESTIITLPPQTECTCEDCVSMCLQYPCAGTPEDIQKLIDTGYRDRLMLNQRWVWTLEEPEHEFEKFYLLPAIKGAEGELHGGYKYGECTFLKNNRCEIHAIKPLEGRLAYHSNTKPEIEAVKNTWFKEWFTPEGRRLVNEFIEDYGLCVIDFQGSYERWMCR